MKKVGTAIALAMIVMTPLVMLAAPSPAQAKGCIKGALVGGVAGHYAGRHGVLGAAAGCIVGRHQAKRQQQANPSAAR
jgi:hypothetical protein